MGASVCSAGPCWPFPDRMHHGYNREDFDFNRPLAVQRCVLSPDNVWYGRLKEGPHLFKLIWSHRHLQAAAKILPVHSIRVRLLWPAGAKAAVDLCL